MKLGIIISTTNSEVVWNALRLANLSIKEKHNVSIFLINSGVEIESINSEKYNTKEQLDSFTKSNGILFACGTCLTSRKSEEKTSCPISTMKDLLSLIETSDKVVTFS